VTLRTAIAALLEDPLDQILAGAILGTTDAGAIADQVSVFVATQLGRAILASATRGMGRRFTPDSGGCVHVATG